MIGIMVVPPAQPNEDACAQQLSLALGLLHKASQSLEKKSESQRTEFTSSVATCVARVEAALEHYDSETRVAVLWGLLQRLAVEGGVTTRTEEMKLPETPAAPAAAEPPKRPPLFFRRNDPKKS